MGKSIAELRAEQALKAEIESLWTALDSLEQRLNDQTKDEGNVDEVIKNYQANQAMSAKAMDELRIDIAGLKGTISGLMGKKSEVNITNQQGDNHKTDVRGGENTIVGKNEGNVS